MKLLKIIITIVCMSKVCCGEIHTQILERVKDKKTNVIVCPKDNTNSEVQVLSTSFEQNNPWREQNNSWRDEAQTMFDTLSLAEDMRIQLGFDSSEESLEESLEGVTQTAESGGPQIITIDYDIYENTIWGEDPNVVYYIPWPIYIGSSPIDPNNLPDPNALPDPNLGAGIQLKILPTQIYLGYWGSLRVRHNAFIVFGRGGQIIDPNTQKRLDNPVEPVWMIPSNAAGILYPLIIEGRDTETISCLSIINNLYVEGAGAAIILDNVALREPVSGNFLHNNDYGIVSLGPKHSAIINNQITLSSCGILMFSVNPSEPNNIDSGSVLMTAHNTILSANVGIEIHGNPNGSMDNAPSFISINDAITLCDIGFNCVNGTLDIDVLHPGFGGNIQDQNFEFPLINPVWATDFPFEILGDGYRWTFLNQECLFKNAGLWNVNEFPFLMGWTTSIEGYPDTNILDIGVHYNTNSSNGGSLIYRLTDFNRDFVTNVFDLSEIFNCWLCVTNSDIWYDPNDFVEPDPNVIVDPNEPVEPPLDPNAIANCVKVDFNKDGIVNLKDYLIFMGDWLQPGETRSNIEINLSNFDEVTGIKSLTFSGYGDNTEGYLWMGNELLGKITIRGEVPIFDLKSYSFGNEFQKLRVVSDEGDNNPEVSEFIVPKFNNKIHDLHQEFIEGSGYVISGFYEGGDLLKVSMLKILGNEIIWSQDLVGESLNMLIPDELIDELTIYKIKKEETQSQMLGGFMMGVSGEDMTIFDDDLFDRWEEIVSRPFSAPTDPNSDRWQEYSQIQALVTISEEELAKAQWEAIQKELLALYRQGIPFIVLYKENFNAENRSWFLQNARVHTWINLAHANYQIGFFIKKQRQFYVNGIGEKVFSWLGRHTVDPNDDDYLGRHENGLSLADEYLMDKPWLKIVNFNVCYGARTNEFPEVLGMYSASNLENHDQVFWSWKNSA